MDWIELKIKSSKETSPYSDSDFKITSINLKVFLNIWVEENNFSLFNDNQSIDLDLLIEEIWLFGIKNLDDLNSIIPKDYARIAKDNDFTTTYFGLVRDWLIINNYERYIDKCWRRKWLNFGQPLWLFNYYLPQKSIDNINGTLIHWGAP